MKKRKIQKSRVMAWILASAMVLSIAPVDVHASETIYFAEDERNVTSDAGSQPAPYDAETQAYQISNAEQLIWFAKLVNDGKTSANAVLAADITMPEGKQWTPIGGNNAQYSGVFDGQNHVIRGLQYDNSESTQVGLFGYIGKDGSVKNVKVNDSNFNAKAIVGVIAGHSAGVIENCESQKNNVVKVDQYYAGGIVGYAIGTIKKCKNEGKITSIKSYAGGIIGCSRGRIIIESCMNSGDVTAESSDVGGIIGYSDGQIIIESCMNSGDVTAGSFDAGGIIGIVTSSRGGIVNCQNRGKIQSNNSAGGIAALFDGYIKDSENSGDVTTVKNDCGGIVGTAGCFSELYIENAINKGNVSGKTLDVYVGGIVGATVNPSNVVNSVNYGKIMCDKGVGGGLVGVLTGSSIVVNSANMGVIEYGNNITQKVGGLVGLSVKSSILNSYSIGSITASDKELSSVGGIVGKASDTTISNVYYNNGNFTGTAGKIDETCAVNQPNDDDQSGSPIFESGQPTLVFQSGKIAYFLNNKGSQLTNIWRQNLDNGQAMDQNPVLTGSAIVYRLKKYDCSGSEKEYPDKYGYSNKIGKVVCHNFTEDEVESTSPDGTTIRKEVCQNCHLTRRKTIQVSSSDVVKEEYIPASPEGKSTGSSLAVGVNVQSPVPSLSVSGMNTDAVKMLLTEEEEKALILGKGVELSVYLDINRMDDVPETVRSLTESKVKEIGNLRQGSYLDFSLYKQSGEETAQKLPDGKTETALSIAVTIPDAWKAPVGEDRKYYVIQVQNGAAAVVDAEVTGNDIHFQTNQPATYSIWYTKKDAPSGGGGSSYVPVTNVVVSPAAATLTKKGQTIQLTAAVEPDNADDRKVTWTSSAPETATIDENGTVTAVADGTATITAKTSNGTTASALITVKIEKEPEPDKPEEPEKKLDTSFGKMRLKVTKSTKTANKLVWAGVSDADGYVVYGAPCNTKTKTYQMKQLAVVKNESATTWTHKKLKSGTYYKYYVKAYKLADGKKEYLALSKTVRAATTGGKYGNVKTVKVKKNAVKLKAGATYTIKAEQVTQDKPVKEYAAIQFESSNAGIASVNKKGVITAKKAGICYIYVYAQNGIYQKVKVTVQP